MNQKILKHLDVASIYLVGVLFLLSIVDYSSIDQSRKVTGLTMLILIMGILLSRVLLRQKRQMREIKEQLKMLTAARAAPRTGPMTAATAATAATASTAGNAVMLAPSVPPTSVEPSNVLELHRR